MCGIAGKVRADGGPIEEGLVQRMCERIEHRGPDSRGVHSARGVALGIQRLRVIDLETGDQPIYNEDRSVAVVLNGEIYNFRELRERLERSGHTFYTRADTEVIVHLYEERGTDCVQELHGMFAFALWDERRQRLLVARDRVGKKPLFYSHGPAYLSFASELPALLADEEVPRELDRRALDSYLRLSYIPAPLSAFSHVRKLPPASTLTYEDGDVRIARYWSLDYTAKIPAAELEDVEERIWAALGAAVRKRMVSDVPLGAFLSGGVDSSAVVAAMAEASPTPIKTFSIGFPSVRYNELPRARLVAERFGTDHHELVLEPHAVDKLPLIVAHHGEPFGDASAVPSFYLAEMARRHVTVALNGDGGDESFGGYQRYSANLLVDRASPVPVAARRAVAAAAAMLPTSGTIDSTLSRVRRLSEMLGLEPAERYFAYSSYLNGLRPERLYTREFAQSVTPTLARELMRERWDEQPATALLDRMLHVDVTTYLPGDLLAKIDIATMAYSLEARSPLLDHDFMQLAASLPPEMKVRGTTRKIALRAALRGRVPDEILDGPKQGFEVPLAEWLRGELRELATDALLDGTARDRGYFDPAQVRALLRTHVDGNADNSRGLWNLLVFELWHRRFVDA